MITPTKRATRRLAASLALITALATTSAWAAGFWKGTGQNSATTGNWTNGKAFMNGDNFYFRDAKMTGTAYNRVMRLNANVNNTGGNMVLFQCGTEDDPFIVEDDGNNRTITLTWKNSTTPGNIYVGNSKNTDNTNADTTDDAGYYGSAVLNGGIWTCNQLYVGDVVNGTNYWGYFRLNGASLTTTGTSENPCANGKIVVDAGELTFAKGMSVGKNGGSAELVINGGTMSCGYDLLLGSASGDNGTLTVNGGTITVSSGWTKGNSSNGTVNLNGGTLMTYHIHEQNGSTTVNFNGGTLQATAAYASNGGLIHGNVAVFVGANGGTIDNGGYDIAIAPALGGTGGLTFTGTGTTTLNGNVNYAGKTAVTPGTILAVANSTAKSNILSHGLVLSGLPTADQTVFTYTSALDDADLDKISCPLAPTTTFKFSDETMTAIVVDVPGAALDNYWTGAVDNDLSNDANWSSGSRPTANANIFSTAPATLTKGDSFAPTSITFLAGSAGVTIDGDFSTLTVITNSSSVNQTFSGAVNFGAGNIDVVQTGICNSSVSGVDGGCVVFAGGVTGNNIANHTVLSGDYTLTTTDKINFKTSGTSRGVLNTGSTLNVKKTDQVQELYIMSGATFHVEEAAHGWNDWTDRNNQNHRLWYRSAGTFIADSYTLTGNGRMWLGGYVNNSDNAAANANAVLKIGTLTINSNGAIILHGYSNGGDSLTTYIGAGGVNIASGKTGYYWVENNTHASTLRPLNSNFTFGKGSNASYDFRIGNGAGNINVIFHTDDEAGVAREITLAARVCTDYNSSSITVKGGGAFKVTSASPLMIGSTIVADTATLEFGEGASFGEVGTAGAITLGAGTTLALTATSREFTPLANTLNLPTTGTATIRIDGARLRSGDYVIATVASGGTDNVTLDPDSAALAGRRGSLSVVQDSEDPTKNNLVLTIEPAGLMVIIR